MTKLPHQISSVLLWVATDLGHGGHLSEYKIDSNKEGHTVTLSISGSSTNSGGSPVPTPQPPSYLTHQAFEESYAEPLRSTEVITKNNKQVGEFLRRLSAEFKVYELPDLKSQYPYLHPTFYPFSLRDSEGRCHSFEYQIECSNHLNEKYERLIREFENFFESERVFNIFFESRRQNK
jgi:hypothetical protein